MKMDLLWFLSVVGRIVWTMYGQTGYIHPDEFFQMVEVVAGDILGVDHLRTWEFNETLPIRNMVVPYITCGPPMWLMKTFMSWMNTSLLTTHAVLVAPRMTFLILSIAGDFLIASMAKKLKKNVRSCLLVYSSSYITLVYYTRTFSNTVEAFLFILLLYLVIKVSTDLDDIKSAEMATIKASQERRTEQDTTSKASTDGEKKDTHKDKPTVTLPKESVSESKQGETRSHQVHTKDAPDKVPHDSKKYHYMRLKNKFSDQAAQIMLVISIGFFNRPTFLAFAFIPYLFWLHRISSYRLEDTSYVRKCLHTVLESSSWFILCASVMIVGDTVYYRGKDSIWYAMSVLSSPYFTGVEWCKIFVDALVLTPWNFLAYNLDEKNLAKHGSHTRSLHLFLNLQLLFNVLAMFAVIGSFRVIHQHFCGKKGSVYKIFLLLSYFVPVFILSMFPHQEPRFLIPLLAPLVLLYSHSLVGGKSFRLLRTLWVVFNAISALMYGVLHQGGMVQWLAYLQLHLASTDGSTNHIVFYHTYMPPRHLLVAPQLGAKSDTLKQDYQPLNARMMNYHIYDMKGASKEALLKKLGQMWSDIQRDPRRRKAKVFVVAPSSLDATFCDISNMSFRLARSFPMHMSGEDPPSPEAVKCEGDVFVTCLKTCTAMTFWERMQALSALNVYAVTPNHALKS